MYTNLQEMKIGFYKRQGLTNEEIEQKQMWAELTKPAFGQPPSWVQELLNRGAK